MLVGFLIELVGCLLDMAGCGSHKPVVVHAGQSVAGATILSTTGRSMDLKQRCINLAIHPGCMLLAVTR